MFILNLFVKKSNKNLNEIYEIILTKDKEAIKTSIYNSERAMRFWYYLYYFFWGTLNIFVWYYVCVFCTIYIGSSKNWIYGGIISIILGYMSNVLFITILSVFRNSLIKNPDNK